MNELVLDGSLVIALLDKGQNVPNDEKFERC